LISNPALSKGVNIARGKVTYAATAKDLGLPYTSLSRLL
jgi:alanine dehydrogenase